MPRESQYTDEYLQETATHPVTIGTFLAYRLKGKARSYAGRYREALHKSVIRRGAKEVKSVGGRTAYTLTGAGSN